MRSTMKDITRDLSALQKMGISALHGKYRDAFGEGTTSRNAAYLRKKIAYRIQELAEGGLSERARLRIRELADGAPLTERIPRALVARAQVPTPDAGRDPRLPADGTVLTKVHRGATHEVTVAPGGFLFKGKMYPSLSTIAKAITGTVWNGWTFFGLATPKVVTA